MKRGHAIDTDFDDSAAGLGAADVQRALEALQSGKAEASHTHAASDVTSGTFADALVSESSVTQHEAAIDHDALVGFVSAEHWAGNDAGTGATEVWSASKLQAALEIREGEWRTGATGQTLTGSRVPVVLNVQVHNTDSANHYTITLGTDSVVVVKIAGWYEFWAAVNFQTTSATESECEAVLAINGTVVVGTACYETIPATDNRGAQVFLKHKALLAADDTVGVQVKVNPGAAQIRDGGGLLFGISRKVGV